MERESWITGNPLRCQVCGVRIGVYEPLTVRVHGLVRTPMAADPSLSALIGEHYHRSCYRSQFYDLCVQRAVGTHEPRRVEHPGGAATHGADRTRLAANKVRSRSRSLP